MSATSIPHNHRPLWWVLVGSALVLRLWQLDARPLHHDESLHAFYSFELARFGTYKYVPFLHGPLLYFLTALDFVLFRTANDFLARLLPALAGSFLVMTPYFLRAQLGMPVALITAAFLAFSPTLLYYSRFLRHDIFSVVLHAVALIGFMKFRIQAQRRWFLVTVEALMLSFVNHELTYISLFLLFCFTLWAWQRQEKSLRALYGEYQFLIWPTLIVTLAIYTLFFTSFFTNPKGFLDGLPNPFASNTSLGYWLSQHGVKRGNQPIYYYLLCLMSYEFVVFGLFLASLGNWRRLWVQPLVPLFFFWSVGALAVYSWAGERMPWLLMHSLLPMLPLAALQLTHLWKEKRRFVYAVLLPLLIFNFWVSLRLNFINHTNPKELMVYVQSSADVQKVTKHIAAFEKTQQRRAKLVIDNELTWPLAWYLRRSEVIGYPSQLYQSIDPSHLKADFILIHLPLENSRVASPAPFVEAGCYSLRDWWVANPKELNLTSTKGLVGLLNWWLTRRIDSGFGSLKFCLFERRT